MDIKIGKYPGFVDIAAIVGVFLGSQVILGGSVVALMLALGAPQELAMAVAYPLYLVATIVFAVYLRRGRESRPYAPRVSFSFERGWLSVLVWSFVTMLAVSMVIEPILDLFPQSWYDFMNKAIGRGGWTVLTTLVMAPLLEEYLMRGVVQDATVSRFGPLKGILLASAVFGVVHVIPMQIISGFVMGLILGYVYYKTGSLLPPVILHAANNAVAYLMMPLTRGDGSPATSLHDVITSDALYWSLYGACVVLAAMGGYRMWRGLKSAGNE